jgi:GNAT superfamily N-acetyltransferase
VHNCQLIHPSEGINRKSITSGGGMVQAAGMASVVIRGARGADAGQIADVFLRARACMPFLPHTHTDEETQRWLTESVLPRQRVSVATIGGTVVGFAATNKGWLHHLYVDPAWHRRGIGTALLRTACDGREHVQLWVFQANDGARRFYTRHGFTLAELTDGASNEERQPDARYEWLSSAVAPRTRL